MWIIKAKPFLAQKDYQEEIKAKMIFKILIEDRIMGIINLLVFLNN